MGMGRLKLGTRGSLLALTQSQWVARRLEESGADPVELVVIRTTGDLIQDRPLSEIGGKGLFTKELDRALLDGSIDLAVHSLKDLPTAMPEGLAIGAIPEREDPRDCLIGPSGHALTLAGIPPGGRIGTSSLRRGAIIRAFRPDLSVLDIRGNLDTRIERVDSGDFEAIVLAAAGVRRLGWGARISEYLNPVECLPAPGQGALAIVVREADWPIRAAVEPLEHPPTRDATLSERSLLRVLEAGCNLPVGSLAIPFGGQLRLRGLVASPDGRQVVRGEASGPAERAETLGAELAEQLFRRGADLILSELR